jgi:hypothetical protein
MGDMDWINLAQDRDQWKGLVKTVINLLVPYNVEIHSRVAEQLAASQQGFSSVELGR